MRFEEIDTGHFAEWGHIGTHPPDDRMTGFAARADDGRLVALAVAYLDDQATWRAAFARRPGCTAGVHLEVRRALEQVLTAGVTELIADADPEVPRSEEYLTWLGFIPVGDGSGDWVLYPEELKGFLT